MRFFRGLRPRQPARLEQPRPLALSRHPPWTSCFVAGPSLAASSPPAAKSLGCMPFAPPELASRLGPWRICWHSCEGAPCRQREARRATPLSLSRCPASGKVPREGCCPQHYVLPGRRCRAWQPELPCKSAGCSQRPAPEWCKHIFSFLHKLLGLQVPAWDSSSKSC